MPNLSLSSSKTPSHEKLELRALRAEDRGPIGELLKRTGFFTEEEIGVALELIDEPAEEGYLFLVAESASRVLGYACFGLTPLTDGVYDLYWIAVDPEAQGQGVGRKLLIAVDDLVRSKGGRMILIETAGKPEYEATRHFYLRTQCIEIARIPNFYRVGDDKIIYCRNL